MTLDARTVAVAVFAAGGVVAVVHGAWLPWLTVEPGHAGPVPAIYVSGMEAGIAGQDYPILALAGVAGAAVVASRWWRFGGLLTLSSGAGIVVLTLWWVVETIGTDGAYLGVFVLGQGAYVTIAGGALFAGAGGVRALTDRARATTERSEVRDV